MQSGEEIRGNALRVYVHLLKHGPSELRDIQRSLGLSTPSLASYHLGRLTRAGYVSQDQYGKYQVTSKPPADILAGYSKVGTAIIPQLFFFSVLFTAVIGFFAVMSFYNGAYVPLLAGGSAVMVAAFWFETTRVWKKLTSWR